jgi:hypothetical protein
VASDIPVAVYFFLELTRATSLIDFKMDEIGIQIQSVVSFGRPCFEYVAYNHLGTDL